MSDEAAAAWSSGLSRTYSEHADLVLQHFERHRRRLEAPKCTRSGPEFRSEALTGDPSSERVQRNDDRNDGQHTWRISSTTSEEDQRRHRNAIESGWGDSSAVLSAELSDLSLTQHRIYENNRAMEASNSSLSRNTVASSVERRCRLFDEEEDDDEDFRLIDLDDEEQPEYRLEDYRREMEKELERGLAIACPRISAKGATSSSGSHQRLNGTPLKRQISYEDWAREKRGELQRRRDEARRAAEQRLAAQERERREREERERREYESYLRWTERKRSEERRRRMLADKELELQRRIEDVEERAKVAKSMCISQWCRKKEEQLKAVEKEEMMKRKKAKEEKERRLQESMKAYEKWREKAKNAPRPATQGLLPHQKAKPAFTNPTPWQPLVGTGSDEDSDNAKPAAPATPAAKPSNVSIKNQRSKKANARR